MLWLNFILGLILFSLICFKLIIKIILPYPTTKENNIKIKDKIELQHIWQKQYNYYISLSKVFY